MAIMMVHQGPTLTRERYGQVVARLTDGKGRQELGVEDAPRTFPAHAFVKS